MSRLGGTTSRHELVLGIGGLVCRVELAGATPPFVEQLLSRYEAFVMPALPGSRYDCELRLRMHSAPPPGRRDALSAAEKHPLAVRATERTITMRRWDFRVGLRAAGGERRLSYQGRGRCELSPFSVDCILRVIWATLLPRVGGMLVHSCGLRHAGVAVVFPGVSGIGKTTLARKANDPDDVLSDELCAIRREHDGWRVHGTPFWGDFARGGVSMRSWPLRSVAFLAQSPRDVVTMTPIASAEATFRLLGCFLSFAHDRATVARNVALVMELASEVRSLEASLTKRVPAAAIFRSLRPHLGTDVNRASVPASTRELISDLSYVLRKRGSYETRNRSQSRRPGAEPVDTIVVRRAKQTELAAGDIGLYWRAGRMPSDDTLVCRQAEGSTRVPRKGSRRRGDVLLGRIELVGADGSTRPLQPRVGDLNRLSGSFVMSLGQHRRTT